MIPDTHENDRRLVLRGCGDQIYQGTSFGGAFSRIARRSIS